MRVGFELVYYISPFTGGKVEFVYEVLTTNLLNFYTLKIDSDYS